MSRYRERTRAWDYMGFVKTLPCCAATSNVGGRCSGGIEADHAGRRGIGQKASDYTCIPLCSQHHRWRTDFAGPFRDWDRERMRAWLLAETAITQRLALARGIDIPEDVRVSV